MNAKMSLCEHCSHLGRTCCQGTDVYVTLGDIDRIAARTGDRGFYEFRRSADLEYEDQPDDPIWAAHVIRPDHSRRVLKHDPEGNCIFLTRAGCALTLTERPLVCRLHPHVYTATGIAPGADNRCPVRFLAPGERLEESIAGYDNALAGPWHRMLYDEIAWKEISDENRTDV